MYYESMNYYEIEKTSLLRNNITQLHTNSIILHLAICFAFPTSVYSLDVHAALIVLCVKYWTAIFYCFVICFLFVPITVLW